MGTARTVAFTEIEDSHVQRSTFDLSHYHLTSIKHGELQPVFCQEVLPGDTFKLNTNVLARYMPLVNPPMSPLKLQVHYFYVPNRLTMRNWENFYLGRTEGGQPISIPTIPNSWYSNAGVKRILDRLGLPVKQYASNGTITDTDFQYLEGMSALPLLAFYKAWIDYYVDQNLDPIFEQYMLNNYDDGIYSNQINDFLNLITDNGNASTKYRAWAHDYFTSLLPWAQRGQAVSLPIDLTISGSVPVQVNHSTQGTDGALSIDNEILTVNGTVSTWLEGFGLFDEDTVNFLQSANINDLRESIALQKYLEMSARVGMRYAQRIGYEFGIDDERIDDHRSVFLGSFTQDVQITEIPQTSQTTTGSGGSPQGNLAANAQLYGSQFNFNYNFPEHGHVIGIVNLSTEAMYSQGIPRMFTKQDRTDYFNPMFDGIGEQPVLNIELVFDEKEENSNHEILGYLPYGSEYRNINSHFSGDTRETLLNWHLGRVFDSSITPQLSKDLVYTENDDFNRIFAVQDSGYDDVILNFHFDLMATRPMSVFGTPTILD